MAEVTVATDGSLTIEGVTAPTRYVGWAQRGGVDYYLAFQAPKVAGTGGPPSGVAGGDLAGEYPEPTLRAGVPKKTIVQTRTFSIPEPKEGETYPGFYVPESGWTLKRADYAVLSGTSATVELLKNGAQLSAGYAGLAAKPEHGEKVENQTLAAGDKIDLKCTGLNTGKGLTVTVTLQREV